MMVVLADPIVNSKMTWLKKPAGSISRGVRDLLNVGCLNNLFCIHGCCKVGGAVDL